MSQDIREFESHRLRQMHGAKFPFSSMQGCVMLRANSKSFRALIGTLLIGLGMCAAQAQDKLRSGSREAGEGNLPKWTCQWEERSPEDYGCTGRIGLMRLSREPYLIYPSSRKKASRILFGTEELPALGSEVTIKRSAHLISHYWPDRDDQDVRKKICTGVGCINNWQKGGSCGTSVGEFSHSARAAKRLMKEPRHKPILCPGPTDLTDYMAAGTVVKILGYQQLGAFFVLVQIVRIESIFPLDDEKKYEFDHNEII